MWRKILVRTTHAVSTLALAACLSVSPHHPGSGVQTNIPLPTLGGVQFWADVEWRSGWRIQENVVFRHHRLLDPDDVRRAWGSRDACRTALDRRNPESGRRIDHLVVLLHGLGRSRQSMAPLSDTLESAGLTTANLSYPSTRAGLEVHARHLNGLLDELGPVGRVSFVTHSMGGIVVRKALGQEATWRDRIELGRVLQLGPPNQGSQLARWFQPTPIGWLLGPCLDSVATSEVQELPGLPCEFAVIAGGKAGEGWNPLLPGDDDGIVRVEETRLTGADEHLAVDALHTFLMRDERVQSIVLDYILTGQIDPGAR